MLVSKKPEFDEVSIKKWLLMTLFLILSLHLLSTHTVLERVMREFPQTGEVLLFLVLSGFHPPFS